MHKYLKKEKVFESVFISFSEKKDELVILPEELPQEIVDVLKKLNINIDFRFPFNSWELSEEQQEDLKSVEKILIDSGFELTTELLKSEDNVI